MSRPCLPHAAAHRPTLRPLTLALHLLLAGGVTGLAGWTPIAQAQSAAAAAHSAARAYDIPPGPLSSVLTRFSREAGVFLIGSGQAADGKVSPGLRGTYTVQAGFAELLTGTGLQAYQQSPDSYGLRTIAVVPAPPPAPASGLVLPAITVTGDLMQDGTTEGTNSYQARSSSTATKLDLTPRETPQTITTVTRQQMDDAGMTSLDDALKSVSGVFSQEQGSAGATYFSRGFGLQAQVDGMNSPGGVDTGNRSPKYDSAFIDRVEVLQGSAGLLTGSGSPGGTVNLVRKRPTQDFQASVEGQVGSWNARRFVGDVGGSIVPSGQIRGRLVAVDDRSDSFTDHIFRDRQGVYGIVEADLTSTTTLSASVQHQNDKGLNHFGVPFAGDGSDAGLPRSSFWGDPEYRLNRDFTLYSVGLTQQLAGAWSVKANYTRQRTINDIGNFNAVVGSLNPITGDGLSISTRSRSNVTTSYADTADIYASGPLTLAGREHELVLGMNGTRNRDESVGTGYIAKAEPFNVYDFNPWDLPEVGDGVPSRTQSRTTNVGLYSVARWNLSDSLKLITGVRSSYYEARNDVTGIVSSKVTGEITPYAGLVYDINSQYSAYASYSDIFRPQTQRNIDGNVLEPVVGANYELGIKGELLDKRLNVAAAVYRLTQSNLALRDDTITPNPGNPCGGTCYTAAGKVVSQGVDLSLNGQVANNLNVTFGYTFVDAEYKAGPQRGERYGTEQPRHNLRLAANYRIPETKWSVGGSLSATSRIHRSGGSGVNAWTIRQGTLVLLGAHARYQITPQTQVLLAVSNLTDRHYRSLYSVNYSPYGEPRKFMVNLKHTF